MWRQNDDCIESYWDADFSGRGFIQIAPAGAGANLFIKLSVRRLRPLSASRRPELRRMTIANPTSIIANSGDGAANGDLWDCH